MDMMDTEELDTLKLTNEERLVNFVKESYNDIFKNHDDTVEGYETF